jgi:hypothetical protein
MSDIPRILSAIDQGDLLATEQLLPLVYDELRKLATQKLAQEKRRAAPSRLPRKCRLCRRPGTHGCKSSARRSCPEATD